MTTPRRVLVAALFAAATFSAVAGCSTHGATGSTPRTSASPAVVAASLRPKTDPASVAADLVVRLNDPRMTDARYRATTINGVLAPNAAGLIARFVPGPAFEAATHLDADRNAGRPTIGQVVALHTTVVSQDATQAVVAVWAVSLVGTAQLGQVVAGWSTDTLTLDRNGARWQLVDYTSTPGPTPQTAQPPDPIATAFTLLAGSTGAGR